MLPEIFPGLGEALAAISGVRQVLGDRDELEAELAEEHAKDLAELANDLTLEIP